MADDLGTFIRDVLVERGLLPINSEDEAQASALADVAGNARESPRSCNRCMFFHIHIIVATVLDEQR